MGKLILRGNTILDDAVDLTAADVQDCTFDGCILTLATAEDLRLVGNQLKDCQLVGDGWDELRTQIGWPQRAGGPG